MPFSEDSLSLADIRDAVAAIEQFTRDMDFDAFREDPKTIAAVERKLQVISEAAVRLGERAEALCPGLPWRNIRGIGNWLRHQYDRVDIETLWNTVTIDLPPLKAAVNRALTSATPAPPKPPVYPKIECLRVYLEYLSGFSQPRMASCATPRQRCCKECVLRIS